MNLSYLAEPRPDRAHPVRTSSTINTDYLNRYCPICPILSLDSISKSKIEYRYSERTVTSRQLGQLCPICLSGNEYRLSEPSEGEVGPRIRQRSDRASQQHGLSALEPARGAA